ncbi:DUF3617 domain-containing protein [Neptunomonas antarctica]|uniref:DUF3617 family protein n=1 Tax=Neptunomonas antarctica TaxID=619304 RepID=A0A1N7LPV5_9GAMM|nr:DUF3617 family protein [Neptunomonas antarctica]SIS75893.1 Protein of unknown function [Neptunomonas antarctica]
MKQFMLSAIMIIASTTIANTASASDSIPFNAGKWEIVSKATMPMLAQPITNKNIECIKENTLSAAHFAEKTQGNCHATDVSAAGQNIKWKMACNLNGSQMTGYGNMHVADTYIKGNVTMVMSLQGINMDMKTTWEGKRLGACN